MFEVCRRSRNFQGDERDAKRGSTTLGRAAAQVTLAAAVARTGTDSFYTACSIANLYFHVVQP